MAKPRFPRKATHEDIEEDGVPAVFSAPAGMDTGSIGTPRTAASQPPQRHDQGLMMPSSPTSRGTLSHRNSSREALVTAQPVSSGPHTSGPHTSGPHTSGPHTSGPQTVATAVEADYRPPAGRRTVTDAPYVPSFGRRKEEQGLKQPYKPSFSSYNPSSRPADHKPSEDTNSSSFFLTEPEEPPSWLQSTSRPSNQKPVFETVKKRHSRIDESIEYKPSLGNPTRGDADYTGSAGSTNTRQPAKKRSLVEGPNFKFASFKGASQRTQPRVLVDLCVALPPGSWLNMKMSPVCQFILER